MNIIISYLSYIRKKETVPSRVFSGEYLDPVNLIYFCGPFFYYIMFYGQKLMLLINFHALASVWDQFP